MIAVNGQYHPGHDNHAHDELITYGNYKAHEIAALFSVGEIVMYDIVTEPCTACIGTKI